MSKQLPEIDSELAYWMRAQRMFFVASAPLSVDGHVNCSPKGGDAFRILGPLEVAYADFTGSGAETAAHLRENGRIVIMFCAFEGPPKIARLHGRGKLIVSGDPAFDSLSSLFVPHPGLRAIVHVSVERVSTSCGYSVPLFKFAGQRDALEKWARAKGPEALREYRAQKNRTSVDGLPAFL